MLGYQLTYRDIETFTVETSVDNVNWDPVLTSKTLATFEGSHAYTCSADPVPMQRFDVPNPGDPKNIARYPPSSNHPFSSMLPCVSIHLSISC